MSDVAMEDNRAFEDGTSVTYGMRFNTEVDVQSHPDGTPRPLGRLNLEISWLDERDVVVPGPFSLSMTVTGEFAVPEEDLTANRSLIERWIDINATHLLWTYARAYIGAITGFGRHAPLTIFTIGVPPPHSLDADTGEQAAISIETPNA